MGPTNLAARHWQMSVGREAIGADDRGAVVAEQLIDDLPTAASANGEYRDPSCDHHPQPSPEATLPPAGLVEVDRRLLANVSPRGFDGLGDRRRHLLFQLADRARTQVHAEGVGQQRDDVALAQAVGARQQTDPGLHTGPEGPARHTLRPGRFGQSVAMPAAQGMELILDDLGSHRRYHDLLVTQRMGIVAAQRLTASAARARLDRHQLVHLLHRHQRATVAFVTRLTSRRPTRRSPLAGATRGLRGRLRRRCPGAATAPSFSGRANSVSSDAILAACCSTTCSRCATRSMASSKLTTSACTACGVRRQSLSEIDGGA